MDRVGKMYRRAYQNRQTDRRIDRHTKTDGHTRKVRQMNELQYWDRQPRLNRHDDRWIDIPGETDRQTDGQTNQDRRMDRYIPQINY